MKLVFKNSNNKKQDIADVQNEEQAINEIKKFVIIKIIVFLIFLLLIIQM